MANGFRRYRGISYPAALVAAAFLIGSTALARGPAAPERPVLATAAQDDAETLLLALLADPEVRAVQARLHAELAATPVGQTPDSAARIDNAIAQWTGSFFFKQLSSYAAQPVFLWSTDDTPRTWRGRALGGVGTAGDNPDNIYRLATIDGGGRYEITGRFHPKTRPAQFTIEIDSGDPAATRMRDQSAKHADMGYQVAMITDRDLKVAADGSFRLTLGGAEGGPDHVALKPGIETVGIRDTLSDWHQRPARLSIRRLDPVPLQAFDRAELRRRVIERLPDYIHFWSGFGTTWFGGPAPNTIVGPIARDGGWGFVAGFRYKLAPDEAILVTIGRNGAAYTGLQITDPWMIAPDARKYQASLNLAQATANPDGSYSYVVSPVDPGVANWIDTAGFREGYAIVRWQGFPAGAAKDGLLRDFKVVRLDDVKALAGLPRLSPEQRRAQIAARISYESRLQ